MFLALSAVFTKETGVRPHPGTRFQSQGVSTMVNAGMRPGSTTIRARIQFDANGQPGRTLMVT